MEQQQTEQQQLANYPAKTRGGGILRLPFLGRFANKDEEQDKNSNAAAQPPQRRRSCDWSAAPLVTECSSDEDVAEGEGASLRAMAEGSHLHVQACIIRLKPEFLDNTQQQQQQQQQKQQNSAGKAATHSYMHTEELQLRLCVPSTATEPVAALQVNGVPIPGSEVSTVLRRDRQGCYVSTDQLAVAQTATIEVYQEGHTWTCGSFVRHGGDDDETTTWTVEFYPMESAVPTSPRKGEEPAPSCELELCVVGKCGGTPCCLSGNVRCQSARRTSPRGTMMGRMPSLPSVSEESVLPAMLSANSLADFKDKSLMTYFDPAIEYARGDGTDPSWFGAGVRVGMGLGLGVCLGMGLGVGLLMSSYQRASQAVKRIAPSTSEVMRLTR